MKKTLVAMVMVCSLVMFTGIPMAGAQSTAVGPSGSATATVPSFLEFSMSQVVKMSVEAGDTDPFNDGTVLSSPAFDFGTLRELKNTKDEFLYMRGEYFYYVLMIAATSGRRYKITETGSVMSGAGGDLSRESVLLIPDYQWLDELGGVAQGAPPGGAFVGSVTTACATDNLVYQSDTTGLARLVRAIIAVSGPPIGADYPFNYSRGYNGTVGQGTKQEYLQWKPIGKDQRSGSYRGTVTFTLVLN